MRTVYIYAIHNNFNDKVYIGQTRDPEARWSKHQRPRLDREIGRVMDRHGIEKFRFEVIHECTEEDWEYWEKFYIDEYDSYKNGYNNSLGGKGLSILEFSDEEVINKYRELQHINNTAEYFGCSKRTVSDILHRHKVPLNKTPINSFEKGHSNYEKYKEFITHERRGVYLPEYDIEFESLIDCAKWMVEEGLTRTDKVVSVQKVLSHNLNKGKDTYSRVKIVDLGKTRS